MRARRVAAEARTHRPVHRIESLLERTRHTHTACTYRPLVTPFGSHPHAKTPNFVVGTAEGPIASELDSSALTNSMLPRGLRHHYRSGWEDALTPRLHW